MPDPELVEGEAGSRALETVGAYATYSFLGPVTKSSRPHHPTLALGELRMARHFRAYSWFGLDALRSSVRAKEGRLAI